MLEKEILPYLQAYVADSILDGHDVGLGAETRLLELGVLNSMEIMRLTAFIENHFGVSVPMDMISAENFRTLAAIAVMVSRLTVSTGLPE